LLRLRIAKGRVGGLLLCAGLFVTAALFVTADAHSQQRVPATSQAPLTAAQVAARVDNFYDRLHSLRARFTELYQGPGVDRSERGSLLLAKGGRMRWEYDDPPGKLFLVDGKDAYFYSPGAGDAQRMAVQKLDDLRTPLRFLLGKTRLSKELDGLTVAEVNGLYRLTGVPHVATSHNGSSQMTSLTLDVNAEGEMQRIVSTQADGTTITFVLSGQVQNPAVAGDAFRFVAPAGVKVVDGLDGSF
jgi:outer membrane lipoprotein carrier protein